MLHIFQHGIYFNPLPPHGGRLSYCAMCTISTYFNPLPPHGGRRVMMRRLSRHMRFQSTPSAWRETDRTVAGTGKAVFQSTPSAWRETILARIPGWERCISIHSLRMEGDKRGIGCGQEAVHFNPLPPHGGRHPCRNTGCAGFHHFIPLPPHGGRHINNENSKYSSSFQSTPSAWRET